MCKVNKTLLAMIIILIAFIGINEARATGEHPPPEACLTTQRLIEEQHRILLQSDSNDLAKLYQEREEFVNQVRSLPRTAKFGKSGKVNHIKQRLSDIDSRIAGKRQAVEFHKQFANR